MKDLFIKHISLSKALKSNGGINAILIDDELQTTYRKKHDNEDEILKRFGLPKLMKFRAIIWDVKCEDDIERIELELKNEAEIYLISPPKREVELLNEAKLKDLKTYEVLPEIGIDDKLHAMFYFEEYFKKDKINADEFIDILKNIDKETSNKIGCFYFCSVNKKEPLEVERLFVELTEKQIPYLEEFKNYRPVYPY